MHSVVWQTNAAPGPVLTAARFTRCDAANFCDRMPSQYRDYSYRITKQLRGNSACHMMGRLAGTSYIADLPWGASRRFVQVRTVVLNEQLRSCFERRYPMRTVNAHAPRIAA